MFYFTPAPLLVSLAVLALVIHFYNDDLIRLFDKYKRRFMLSEPAKGTIWYQLDRLKISRVGFVTIICATSVGGLFIGMVLNNPVAGVLLVFFGSAFWVSKVRFAYREYKAKIDEQVETSLLSIISLYQTNNDLIKSIEGTAKCTPSPMREELLNAVLEFNLAKPMDKVLYGLADRTDNRDVEVFAKGVIISEQYGTDTVEVMRDVAKVISDRLSLKDQIANEIKGQKFTVSIFILALPVVTTLLIIFSDMARSTLIETFMGKFLLCIMIYVEFAAWHITRKQGVPEEI